MENSSELTVELAIEKYTLIVSLSFLSLCFICSLFILCHLQKREHKRKNVRIQIQRPRSTSSTDSAVTTFFLNTSDTKNTILLMTRRELFTRLTLYSITFMMISDFIFTIIYFMTNSVRLVLIIVHVSDVVRMPISHVVNTLAELSEVFMIASCTWSLFTSLNIYYTIRTIHTHHEHSTVGSTRGVEGVEDNSTNETMTRYKKLYFLTAFMIPLFFCIVWITIAEVTPAYIKKGPIVYFAEIIPDCIRTSIYIILEIIALVIRILVYISTRNIVHSAAFVKNSAAAVKRQDKLKTLVRQLTMYTTPFIFFGIWIVIMRTYLDSWYTYLVVKKGLESFTTGNISLTGHILTGLQRIFTPMKVLMNAVVYGILTKWFKKRIKTWCCGSPDETKIEKEGETTPLII